MSSSFVTEDSVLSLTISRSSSASAETRTAWETLITSVQHVGMVRDSPIYFDHLCDSEKAASLALATLSDRTGRIVCPVALLVERVSLRFEVSGHVLAESGSSGVRIVGRLGLVPAQPKTYDLFFNALCEAFPECGIFALESVPVETPLWQYFQQSHSLRALLDVYLPDAIRQCHMIPLPGTFEEFVGCFSAKKRYNLRRQHRLLREHGGGPVELHRFDSAYQVPALVESLLALGGVAETRTRRLTRSWYTPAIDEPRLRSLADHGMLLAYVLTCGGRPCAAGYGTVYERVYYLDSFLRLRSLDRFSPGTTLLHLLIEDLIQRRAANLIDLGFGEPSYRHSATNVTEARATVLLMRPTAANQIRRAVHRVFKGGVNGLKAIMGRR
jgi:CelD/BcsL family acetyltransferase involved in cellulose biosynthesis